MSHHPNRDDYLLLGLFGLWWLAAAEEEQAEQERLEEERQEREREEEERLEEEREEKRQGNL